MEPSVETNEPLVILESNVVIEKIFIECDIKRCTENSKYEAYGLYLCATHRWQLLISNFDLTKIKYLAEECFAPKCYKIATHKIVVPDMHDSYKFIYKVCYDHAIEIYSTISKIDVHLPASIPPDTSVMVHYHKDELDLSICGIEGCLEPAENRACKFRHTFTNNYTDPRCCKFGSFHGEIATHEIVFIEAPEWFKLQVCKYCATTIMKS